jgi:hypothetical protein
MRPNPRESSANCGYSPAQRQNGEDAETPVSMRTCAPSSTLTAMLAMQKVVGSSPIIRFEQTLWKSRGTQPPQARRRHRDRQRRLALPARLEIRKPLAHELVTGKVGGYFQHTSIVDGSSRSVGTSRHRRRHRRDPPSTHFGPRSKGTKGTMGQYRPMTRSLSHSMPSTPRRFLLLPDESLAAPGRGPRIRRYRLASVARRSGPGAGDRSPRRPTADGEGQ